MYTSYFNNKGNIYFNIIFIIFKKRLQYLLKYHKSEIAPLF